MKKLIYCLCFIALAPGARAQTQDIQQLILDLEKLTQLKGILSDMKTGYTMLSGGYNEVKQVTSGNFNLHSTFLNAMMMVSPAVSKYGRVADILLEQGYILTEYTGAFKRFKQSGRFTAAEVAYLAGVYASLLQQSLQNIDQLSMILTAGKLRMSDDERLAAVDRIYTDTDDKLTFLRAFDQQATILAVQRQHETDDVHGIQNLYPHE